MTPRRASLCALFTLLASAAFAGAPGHSLYERLGGGPKVTAFVNQTIERFAAASRADASLEPANFQSLKAALLGRICALSGGGCPDARLAIDAASYPALVDALRGAMRAQDVPLAVRNELLDVLGPASRDVAQL